MKSEAWDRVARIAFVVGCAPTVVTGFVMSFVPSTSLTQWLLLGMSLSSYAVLFLGVLVGFLVGGLLAAPFWITARVIGRRERHPGTSEVQAGISETLK